MYNLNTQNDATKTEHIHTRNRDVAIALVACLATPDHEHFVVDEYLSKRAGYTVFSVRSEIGNPESETATISDLGTRFEINTHVNGRTTCVWYDER